MYVINKGNEKICVYNREDARAITNLLTDLNCSESIRQQHIIGTNCSPEYIVTIGDEEVLVNEQCDVEMLIRWILTLGGKTITVERKSI